MLLLDRQRLPPLVEPARRQMLFSMGKERLAGRKMGEDELRSKESGVLPTTNSTRNTRNTRTSSLYDVLHLRESGGVGDSRLGEFDRGVYCDLMSCVSALALATLAVTRFPDGPTRRCRIRLRHPFPPGNPLTLAGRYDVGKNQKGQSKNER